MLRLAGLVRADAVIRVLGIPGGCRVKLSVPFDAGPHHLFAATTCTTFLLHDFFCCCIMASVLDPAHDASKASRVLHFLRLIRRDAFACVSLLCRLRDRGESETLMTDMLMQ